jgi:excisionase family DNA binding protein
MTRIARSDRHLIGQVIDHIDAIRRGVPHLGLPPFLRTRRSQAGRVRPAIPIVSSPPVRAVKAGDALRPWAGIPALTALASSRHEESPTISLVWTFAWTIPWTSTAHAGPHDNPHHSISSNIGTPSDLPQTDIPEYDRLVYTVAEVGDLLGISRAFAYELVARGELPVVRLGRRRLVPKIALLALIGADHHDVGPADGPESAGPVTPIAS